MAWHHSGFSVHAGNQVARDDRDGQGPGGKYSAKRLFSEEKIPCLEYTGKVLYRSAVTHGSNKENSNVFSAEEFIAAIDQHFSRQTFSDGQVL